MKTAIALVVRDEATEITEWCAYHLDTLGINRAIIFNNGSQDATPDRIRALQRHYQIDLIDWPDVPGRDRVQHQTMAYTQAARTLVGQCDWLACIDADEYLHSTTGGTIDQLLAPQPYDVSQVQLPWAVFGSSGHLTPPVGLTIESYTWRLHLRHPTNAHVKAIVRPERAVEALNSHTFNVRGRTVDAHGNDFVWAPGSLSVVAGQPAVANWRLNHFMTRSRAHWDRRALRGSGYGTRTEEHWRQLNLGEECDISAGHFYGQRLHAALAAVTTESIDALPPMARAEGA